AMAPANGWPMPQRMFWIASASPNTSRLQSLACDIGVRKNPSVARGPKLIMEARQPHTTITTGVRHPIVEAFGPEGNETGMPGNPVRQTGEQKPSQEGRAGRPAESDPCRRQLECRSGATS